MRFFEIVNLSPIAGEVVAVYHETELKAAWSKQYESVGTELRVYRTDDSGLCAVTDADEFRSVIKAGGYTNTDGTFTAIDIERIKRNYEVMWCHQYCFRSGDMMKPFPIQPVPIEYVVPPMSLEEAKAIADGYLSYTRKDAYLYYDGEYIMRRKWHYGDIAKEPLERRSECKGFGTGRWKGYYGPWESYKRE